MNKLRNHLNLITLASQQMSSEIESGSLIASLETAEQIQLAAASSAALLKQKLHEQLPSGYERVLLVEDDASQRVLIANTLRKDGFFVAEVSNGNEAIEYLVEMPQPDVIITDLAMPECDGWELINVARTSRMGQGVLIVALTGYDTEDNTLPRADLILKKPINTSALSEQLQTLLDKRPVECIESTAVTHTGAGSSSASPSDYNFFGSSLQN